MNDLSRRQFIRKGGISLLGAAVAMNTGSIAFANTLKVPFEPIRFAVISDLHVDIQGTNGFRLSADSVACLHHTIADLNAEKELAFVMINGDLLTDGEAENASIVREALKTLKHQSFVLCGNHDYQPADTKKHRDGFTYLTIDDFVQYFSGYGYDGSGKRYYAKQIVPGLRMLALDACLPLEQKKWGGHLPDEQLSWLDNELSLHKDQINLVFMHHNFIPWTVDELKGGPKQWFCIDNAAEVRSILEKNSQANPIAFSGHRHIGLHTRELNKINYFALPSLNSHPMRYSIFTLSSEQIAWKTPMVSVSEEKHIEARQALLSATWWRDEQYSQRNTRNDSEVLNLYENNDKIIGTRPLKRG
ncbi:Calcineurin-like phosphoesterase [Desulfuromusa kysingii]|uniref:Calcineurin-like phosphoesterase n=1 Tax=Desulfuromusa kysingii TaxID=37625 RepID=A0A1H3ZTC3_9BACT|nr:metallophosphoesterase [Desulfuromusa kysingii]SEA26918.1 Calcineurin-like phosphoesterase [Desulfuromusa kysingii]